MTDSVHRPRKAYPKSVDGSFYVEDECCTMCGVPVDTAPANFAWDGDGPCYVSRQPTDAGELEAVVTAMRFQELSCIRYRGSDIGILTRLAENDMAALCDEAPPSGVVALTRDHVTFRSAAAAQLAPLDAAEDFVRCLKADAKAHGRRIKARTHVSYSGAVTARVAWYGDRFHTVGFKSLADGRLLARHNVAVGRAVSRLLHDWLTASDRFTDIRWRTSDQFRAGEPGQALPM